jgi:excisionase family DNA binding protein
MSGGNGRDKLLSQKQAAVLCQCSDSAVGGWLDRGELPFIRLPSGVRRIRLSDIERFIDVPIVENKKADR